MRAYLVVKWEGERFANNKRIFIPGSLILFGQHDTPPLL